MTNNFFFISSAKEQADSQKLVDIIKDDGWISRDTIIVNCFPNYSSRLVQYVNHKLSHLNKNELFEVINLEIPYPNTNQVWNGECKCIENYDSYLRNWVMDKIFTNKFLFVSSDMMEMRNFNKIKLSVKQLLGYENFRFATLYSEESSVVDYCTERLNGEEQGRILFEWENSDNPNWNY